MRIYTRTGDRGETGLLGGTRVPKDHIRIGAYGEIDELNAQIGLLRLAIDDPTIHSMLGSIQHLLFEAGSELARPTGTGTDRERLREEDVLTLEAAIDRLDSVLPPLTKFILPVGTEAACRAHVARAVCRRAERSVVHLLRIEPGETEVVRYLNRLSDFLFVLARWANHGAGVPEMTWTPRRKAEKRDNQGGPSPTT